MYLHFTSSNDNEHQVIVLSARAELQEEEDEEEKETQVSIVFEVTYLESNEKNQVRLLWGNFDESSSSKCFQKAKTASKLLSMCLIFIFLTSVETVEKKLTELKLEQEEDSDSQVSTKKPAKKSKLDKKSGKSAISPMAQKLKERVKDFESSFKGTLHINM